MWSGDVTTDSHRRPVDRHKHVLLGGVFGYRDTGSVMWTGRVYETGTRTIYTMDYLFTPAEPTPPTRTVVSYLGHAFEDDGNFAYNLNDVELPEDWKGKYKLYISYKYPGNSVNKISYVRKQMTSLVIYAPKDWWTGFSITVETQFGQILSPLNVNQPAY